MKLRHKICKLAQPVSYRRAWRRTQRRIFPLPFAQIRSAIDEEKLRDIQARYARSQAGYAKYTDIDFWLRLNCERVQDLKLHRSLPKRVLDLGCGGGFFLFILKTLGHSVRGLDSADVPLYPELLELFGIERVTWKIEPFEPLPNFKETFDWITAFSVSFNVERSNERLWSAQEWDFLLRDLEQYLAPRGKIFFTLNPQVGGNYYTPELRELFLRRGARIERERVFFPKGISESRDS
jgi:SAM-dependent methyltransferase